MRRQHAFTLIEVLVALAVFGVLSALAYMALGQTLNNSDMLTERMDRLQSIQRTVNYLSNELLQAAPRPIRAYQTSTACFRAPRRATPGTAASTLSIRFRVSAGSITSSNSKCEAALTALPIW